MKKARLNVRVITDSDSLKFLIGGVAQCQALILVRPPNIFPRSKSYRYSLTSAQETVGGRDAATTCSRACLLVPQFKVLNEDTNAGLRDAPKMLRSLR
jgi:hypothetical protein